jgi:hypothetical protein
LFFIRLNDLCKNIFVPWTNDKQFSTTSIDQYPLLIGVSRDTNGDYSFTHLIEGSNKKPNVEEFMVCLKEYKEKFDTSEQQLEKAKVIIFDFIKKLILYFSFSGRSKTTNVI